MNFLQVGLLISFFVTTARGYVQSEFFDIITNATNVIADYFSINCMYFIGDQTVKDYKSLADLVRGKYGKTIAFCNLSNYNNLLSRGNKDQCHTPLRIILQLDNTNFADEFKDFNDTYLKYSEKAASGVWLIFLQSLQDDFIVRFFKNTYLPFNLETVVAWINKTEVHFKEVYQVAPYFPIRQPYFGNWSLNAGFRFPKNPSRHFRRTDLEGLQLRVDYIDGNEPYVMANTLTGYLVDIWQILENRMNMSSQYRKIEFKREKDAAKNSWLRIMNGIWRKQTDVGLADFVSTSSRVNMFAFSYPLFVTYFQLLFKIFDNEVLSHTLLLPFEKEIFLAAVFWFLIHSLTIFFASHVFKKLAKNREINFRLPTALFLTFTAICGQGVPNMPKSSSCRILFLLIFVVATVLINLYSASLTQYLTAKPSNVDFRDLKNFYEIGTHKLAVVLGSFEFHIFNITTNNVYEMKIFEKYIKNQDLPKTYKEALELICYTEKTAFYTMASIFLLEWKRGENKHLRDECVLKTSQNARKVINGMLYSKDFRFKGLIDHHLKILHSRGIISRLRMKYWGAYPVMEKKLWDSVTLQESMGLFQILLCGIVLSCISVLVEVFVTKRSIRRVVAKKKRINRLVFV